MKQLEHLKSGEDKALFFIFGATGDLAKRKLFPALYSLYREGKLSNRFAVVGLARRERTNEQFRQDVFCSIRDFARHQLEPGDDWESFSRHFEYMSLDIENTACFQELCSRAEMLEKKYEIPGNRLFYLALAPEHFGKVALNLRQGGLLRSSGWHRLVIEKPFGYDKQSAEQLNAEIRQVFDENDIFRIDHYLGKEMVQNIEVVRFANAFFEPLWNNKYIANVQITMSETVGVEERGAYYEKSGALRDMVQNHMLQMLTLVALEPPGRRLAEDVRNEKVKILHALRKYCSRDEVLSHVVRGQYQEGMIDKPVRAYREEDAVSPVSNTETYFAAKVFIDNYRWAGVPFYIRTGKRLKAKSTEIVIEFKQMPDNIYFAKNGKLKPNLLVFRVNPLEGIYFKINAQTNGSGEIQPVEIDFCRNNEIGINTPEAYERLLLDAVRGDSTHFTRWDEVDLAWEFIDSIAGGWADDASDLCSYAAGSWGPVEAAELLAGDGFKWWPVQGQDEDEDTSISQGGGI